MYGLYDDLHFTHDEQLYSKVSHKRFIAYLRRKNVTIVSMRRGKNNYGEFLFVTVLIPRPKYRKDYVEAITFYGNGYHDYRDIVSPDWTFYVGNNFYSECKPLNKNKVIKAINDERLSYSFDDKPKNNLFTLLADMSDDDSAYTELFQ